MNDLTPEQRQLLQGEGPHRLRDPETNRTYILVPEETFDRMRKIVDGFARSAGWDDSELDTYEQYRNQP